MNKEELKEFLQSATEDVQEMLWALEDGELLSRIAVSQETVEELYSELQPNRNNA